MTRVGPPRVAWAAVAEARGLTFEPGPGRCLGTLTGALGDSEVCVISSGFGVALPSFGPAYDVETHLSLTLPDHVEPDALEDEVRRRVAPHVPAGWDLDREMEGWLTTRAQLEAWLDEAAAAAALVCATCGTEPGPTAGHLAAALRAELRLTGLWTPEGALPRYRGGPFGEDHMSFDQWIQAVLVVRLDDVAAGHLALPAESALAVRATREWDGQAARVGLLPELIRAVDRLAEWPR